MFSSNFWDLDFIGLTPESETTGYLNDICELLNDVFKNKGGISLIDVVNNSFEEILFNDVFVYSCFSLKCYELCIYYLDLVLTICSDKLVLDKNINEVGFNNFYFKNEKLFFNYFCKVVKIILYYEIN